MEPFGDPHLVNEDLLPASDERRVIGARQKNAVWAAVVLSPGVYAFAFFHRQLPVWGALAALGIALVTAAALARILARTPARYGIPFVVQCRLVLGARGAAVALVLRWLVGFGFVAAWSLESAMWIRRLLLFALHWSGIDDGTAVDALAWHFPWRGGIAAATWCIAVLLHLAAWRIARGGMRAVVRWAIGGLVAALATGTVLAIYAGILSGGFGPWLHRSPAWGIGDLVAAAAGGLLVLVPALCCTADWVRFGKKPRDATGVWGIFLAVPIVASIGALVANAAEARLGQIAGHPIADAAGFGHLGAAFCALVFSVAMWLAAAPMVGLYAPGLSLSGLRANWFNHRRAIGVTGLVLAITLPAAGAAAEFGVSWKEFAVALAPVFALLVVDEGLRRRRLVLEDAYLVDSDYGVSAGVRLAGLVSLVLAWLLHPWALRAWGPLIAGDVPGWRRIFASPFYAPGAVVLGAVVAGGAFFLLGPLEVWLVHQLRRAMAERRRVRMSRDTPKWLGHDDAALNENTNPHFRYDPKPEGNIDETAAENKTTGTAEDDG